MRSGAWDAAYIFLFDLGDGYMDMFTLCTLRMYAHYCMYVKLQ